VPFYLAELAEKITQDDRIQILKASQAKLKVIAVHYPYYIVQSLSANIAASSRAFGHIFPSKLNVFTYLEVLLYIN
jgi:hypothetical protein